MQSNSGLIELRTLGGLDLRTPDGALVQSVLAQPRRAALLIYLALARPRGHHQRDTLLGLFWAERDGERARKALRQSLYYLRTSLGDDVIVSIGDGEVGMDPGSLRSDVAELDRALREGRPADALALYQGDLLPGFYVDDAPDFERWLDLERDWVRTRAAEAAWQLADTRIAAGDAPAAAEAAKRAAALAPLDETGARRLMDLLERCGDSAAAVRAFEAFAWRLEQEYELEPSPETRALAQAIRARSAAPLPPAPVTITPPAAAPDVAPIMSEAPAPVATPEEPVAHVPRPLRILGELRRRRVFRVAAAYSVAAFVMMQVVDVVFPALLLPDWVSRFVIFLLILGFPIALSLAWAFEVTPDGQLRRETASAARPAGHVQPRARWLAAAVVTLLLLATSTLGAMKWPALRDTIAGWRAPPLDSTRYVVFPFDRDSAAPAQLREAELLHDALSRWNGISVAHPVQVRDALARRTPGRLTADDARSIAALLGAQHYVMGSVTRLGSGVRVHAAVYDAAGPAATPVSRATVDLAHARTTSSDSAFRALSSALLFTSAASPELDLPNTWDVGARRAWEAARSALASWDGARADSLLMTAIRADPSYARAHLDLAQLRMWMGRPVGEWRASAERAAALGDRLTPTEQHLARGVGLIAQGDMPAACNAFAATLAADAASFAAWMGAAECRRRDFVVVRNVRSPSGWSFRASYHHAVQAYRRAFSIAPAAMKLLAADSYARLRSHLLTATTRTVRGRPLPLDSTAPPLFYALPVFRDSLLLVPEPAREGAALNAFTAAHAAAVRRQRQIFGELAATWSRQQPDHAEPLEMVALALELAADESALDTLMRARNRATHPDQQLRLAVAEAWLNVKLGMPDDLQRLQRAKQIADSILSIPVARGEHQLATLAALTGHASLAARLWPPSVTAVPLSASVQQQAHALLTHAALGSPGDTLRRHAATLSSTIRSTVPPAEQAAALSMTFARAAGLAFPFAPELALSWIAPDGDYLLEAQAALAAGNIAAVLRTIATRATEREFTPPADLPMDGLYPEAELLRAAGAPGAAAEWLDPSLDALRFTAPQPFNDVARAGAFMRALMLRASIAHELGDTATATRWARAALTLWSDADAGLQQHVQAMRRITGTDHR